MKYLHYFLALLAILNVTSLSACQLSMRVGENPPLSYRAKDQTWTGLDIELANELAKQIDCRLQFIELPWKRALTNLREGKVDLVANMTRLPDREMYAHFIGPEREETFVLLVDNTVNIEIKSLDDLQKLNGQIGVQLGVFYGPEFTYRHQNDLSFHRLIEAVPSDTDNMRKFERNRIIGFVSDYYWLRYQLRNHPPKRKAKVEQFIIKTNPVYFGFSKLSVDPTTIEKAEAVIKTPRLKSRFSDIISRYEQ